MPKEDAREQQYERVEPKVGGGTGNPDQSPGMDSEMGHYLDLYVHHYHSGPFFHDQVPRFCNGQGHCHH